MKIKRERIPSTRERVLLSDVLPFELPPTFSNRGLYHFLVRNKVRLTHTAVEWKTGGALTELIVRLLFLVHHSVPRQDFKKSINRKHQNFSKLPIEQTSRRSRAFQFKIKHKEDSFRELSIPHPLAQIDVLNFYHEYKESILYYAGLSLSSLRRPCKPASHVYFTDRYHVDHFRKSISDIELIDEEYENLKSFFVYEKFGNIHKFYESDEFHSCEKRYNEMVKLDISKCFDSLYTHSIAWAIYGKSAVKQHFMAPGTKGNLNYTFADRFDRLMQNVNGGETNGIIIGPEFSRVFAEIILQAVDIKVSCCLERTKRNITRGKDYEMYRYIDDYFIFYNSPDIKRAVLDALQTELREFKLHLNEGKGKTYSKPIITEITIAKDRIARLFEVAFNFELSVDDSGTKRGSIPFNTRRTIIDFKTIIKEANVEYRDLLNWALSIIELKVDNVISKYLKNTDMLSSQELISQFVLDVLEFSFFIYSVSPRVNTTLRICRIFTKLNLFVREHCAEWLLLHEFQSRVFTNTLFLLEKFSHEHITQVETLYLLLIVSELDEHYSLSQDQLLHHFAIDLGSSNHDDPNRFNYLTITVLLAYIKNSPKYPSVKKFLEDTVRRRLIDPGSFKKWDGESVLLLLDVIVCPYIGWPLKNAILKEFGASSRTIRRALSKTKLNMFTTWTDFDIRKALDSKRSLEVY